MFAGRHVVAVQAGQPALAEVRLAGGIVGGVQRLAVGRECQVAEVQLRVAEDGPALLLLEVVQEDDRLDLVVVEES